MWHDSGIDKSEKSYQKTEMGKVDRLSTLMERFRLSARLALPGEATLVAVRDEEGKPDALFLSAKPIETDVYNQHVILSAFVDWGSELNPLYLSLPELIRHRLSEDPGTRSLIELSEGELRNHRCGADSVVCRLTEVLLVRLLRVQIEAGQVGPGLLAGLSDPRLSGSLVAIHDNPERLWNNEDLAHVAGLSLSRFVELFQQRVGDTPASYLRRWRLTLARQDLSNGARVDRVAYKYGFRSTPGFSKAFKRQFGAHPISVRK